MTNSCESFERRAKDGLSGGGCQTDEVREAERACVLSFENWGDFIDTALHHGFSERDRGFGYVADAERFLGMANGLWKTNAVKAHEFFGKATWAAGDAANSFVRCRAYASQVDSKYAIYKKNYEFYVRIDASCRRKNPPPSLSNTYSESDRLRQECEKGGGDAAEVESTANSTAQGMGGSVSAGDR